MCEVFEKVKYVVYINTIEKKNLNQNNNQPKNHNKNKMIKEFTPTGLHLLEPPSMD
jgi:hypothetical protein